MLNQESFVYKWTHIPTLRWYVGWHIGSIDDGYICAHRHRFEPALKDQIKANPTEWVRDIIMFGDRQETYDFETTILQTFDARNDPRSFNQHNNIKRQVGKPGDRAGSRNTFYGKKHSKQSMDQMVATRRAMGYYDNITQATRDKISASTKGVSKPASQGINLSKWRTNTKRINKDGKSKFVKETDLQQWLDSGWNLGAKKSTP